MRADSFWRRSSICLPSSHGWRAAKRYDGAGRKKPPVGIILDGGGLRDVHLLVFCDSPPRCPAGARASHEGPEDSTRAMTNTGISNGRLGMMLLVGTETILFTSFIGAYIV